MAATKTNKFHSIKVAEFGEYYTFETEWHDRIMVALKKKGVPHEKNDHLKDLVNYFTKVRGFKNSGEGFLSQKVFVATCLMNEFFEKQKVKIISVESITAGNGRVGKKVIPEETFWGYRVFYQ